MGTEGLNTAIEEMANFVHPDFHKKIGYIKDVAAGAVFFSALTAIIIGCFIYFPKF
jgi:diacylglycerol kinase